MNKEVAIKFLKATAVQLSSVLYTWYGTVGKMVGTIHELVNAEKCSGAGLAIDIDVPW
jgi:hypothetical protein